MLLVHVHIHSNFSLQCARCENKLGSIWISLCHLFYRFKTSLLHCNIVQNTRRPQRYAGMAQSPLSPPAFCLKSILCLTALTLVCPLFPSPLSFAPLIECRPTALRGLCGWILLKIIFDILLSARLWWTFNSMCDFRNETLRHSCLW